MDLSNEKSELPRRRGRAVLLAVVASVSLLAVACGGGDDDDAVATLTDDGGTDAGGADGVTTNDGADPLRSDEESALEFSQCMREGGVEGFPDPEVAQDGLMTFSIEGLLGLDLQSGALGEAFVACSPLIADVTFGGQLGTLVNGLQEAVVDHGECLRDEGLDVGDVDLGAGGLGGAGASGDADRFEFIAGLYGVDADDPAVAAALEACDSILAGIGGGGS